MKDWITDSQDEQNLDELFRGADQLQIPIFQRQYVWKQKQFDELVADIEVVRSEEESTQFLGAIVGYEPRIGSSGVSKVRALDLVDGQQRITTLYIFALAVAELVAKYDKSTALDIIENYLITSKRGLTINTRIIPSYYDRSQFRLIWDRLNTPELLQGEFDTIPTPPDPSGEQDGDLSRQYGRISRYLRKEVNDFSDEDKIAYLSRTVEIIIHKLTFVHLKLNDASSATKIFERLNFRGVKVGIKDLVKNVIFNDIANEPEKAYQIYQSSWLPFEKGFEGNTENFFFPYCLIFNSNSKKSELFLQLKDIWNGKAPEEIVEHMKAFQGVFLAIDKTGKVIDAPRTSKVLTKLISSGRPSSIYPFVMSLVKAVESDEISDETGALILQALESFLVRRAIVGYEPTGLHAVFKGLWKQLKDSGSVNVDSFEDVVKSKPTVQWPRDSEVERALKTRSIASSGICSYLLVEYNTHLGGDIPSDSPTIEHVLPQKIEEGSQWSKDFSFDSQKELVNTLANLIPLSQPLNSKLQNADYQLKRNRYFEDSMFKAARRFAEDWTQWTEEDINKRADMIVKWALERWKYSYI